MASLRYSFQFSGEDHSLDLIHVEGTHGSPYSFGNASASAQVNVRDFYIASTPLTKALWSHVMTSNPAIGTGNRKPMQNISWDQITLPGGFFDTINAGNILQHLSRQLLSATNLRFRLPTETEWEYAARGGPHWHDNFRYSGSHEIESVAWFVGNSKDSAHDVALKAPNQLGLYDMCGNIWELCYDTHTRDINAIPTDGSPYAGPGPDRILRGGCFHNWAEHCTVYKRYEIGSEFHDGCIDFRLVLGTT